MLATSTLRRPSEYRTVTCVMAESCSRAAASVFCRSSTLRTLGTDSGKISALLSAVPLPRRAIGVICAPPRAAAAAAWAASFRPMGDISEVWAKPVASPTVTRMPAPRSRLETIASTRFSSYSAAPLCLSSTNTSAHSPPLLIAVESTF